MRVSCRRRPGRLAIGCVLLLVVPSRGDAQEGWKVGRAEPVADGTWRAKYPLTAVEQVVRGTGGRLLVRDRQADGVLVLDREGRFVHELGQRGEGPGEFVQISGVGVTGDTVWVLDWGLDRVTLFGEDGRVLRTQRAMGSARLASRLRGSLPVAYLGAARVAVVSAVGRTRPAERYAVSIVVNGEGDADVWRVLDASDRTLLVGSEAGRLMMDQPFSFSDVFTVIPETGERVVLERPPVKGQSGVYRLILYGEDGLQQVEVPYVPERLAETAARSDLRAMLPDLSARPDGRELRDAAMDALFVPAYRPPVPNVRRGPLDRSILGGSGGLIWIARRKATEEQGELWDVVSPTEGRLASVALPRGVRLMALGMTEVWGVRRDDFDVPRLVRMSLEHR